MTLPAGSDRLLDRTRAAILAEILAARAAYAPDWLPTPSGAGHGLVDITAGQLELLQRRLAEVPNHRLAVLLDLLGASRLPAQGARTHLLLTAPAGTRGGRVPAGTRVGAAVKVPDEQNPDAPPQDRQVVFETMDDVAAAPAAIVEVHSVLPGADAEQDHSADALAHRPFTLFDDPAPVARALYIGHDGLLAFDGRAVVELQFGFSTPAPAPLRLEWTWWDGERWRPFAESKASPLEAGDDNSVDTTAGFTRSGTVRLVAPVATAKPLTLEGRETYWIRGTLTAPLDLPDGTPPPTIARLRLAAVNEHRRLRVQREPVPNLPQSLNVRVHWPLAPDHQATVHHLDLTANPATADPVSKDITLPREAVPGLDSVGAQHVVRLGVSPQGSTGTGALRFALDGDHDLTDPLVADPGMLLHVSVTEGLTLDKGVADLRAVDLSKTFAPFGPSPDRGSAFHFACATATARPGTQVTLVVERPRTTAEETTAKSDQQRNAAQEMVDLLLEAIADLEGAKVRGKLTDALTELNAPLPELRGPGLIDANGTVIRSANTWFADLSQPIESGIQAALDRLVNDTPQQVSASTSATSSRQSLWTAMDTIVATLGGALPALPGVVGGVIGWPSAAFPSTEYVPLRDVIDQIAAAETSLNAIKGRVPASVPNDLLRMEPTAYIEAAKDKLAAVKSLVSDARDNLDLAVAKLKKLSGPALAVQASSVELTRLTPPEVAWEYHDGERWRPLTVAPEVDKDVLALQASGSIHFTVPDDIADVDLDGDVRRWLRARLAEGTYAHLNLVSWTGKDNMPNFLPVVEPRAPLLDRIEVFYSHHSDPVDAGAVLADDVHQWRDLTRAVSWPSAGGSPFVPMPDRAPTLYLGLDGELPAHRIGLWLQPADPSPWASAHRPSWEGWDGAAWTHLSVDDGTDGLRRPGVVGLLWPGSDAAPGITVTGALRSTITLAGRGAALRFSPGDRLLLQDVAGQVPVVVASTTGETVTTRDPLPRAFAGARLVAAPPARFGTPRTWIRALFDPTLPPPRLALARLAAHAVEVAQVETRRDEVLGSGDGSSGQVLTAPRFRLEGDTDLMVRELDGDAADLDQDVLTRTLVADGVDPAGIRVERDTRTGRVTEVWVPWAEAFSLGGAGPADRAYVVDRAQGRFLFGGEGHGRPLPAGRDNVRLRSYRTTDGAIGNVEAGTITALLSPVALSEVGNPLRSAGGADVEPLDATLGRAPGLLRHRRLALTEGDVEAIALESSPAVARARALGARDRWGRPSPGTVRVVIVPRDGSDRPTPGAGLLGLVHSAIAERTPAVAAPRVLVEGPCYLPVGIAVTVIPLFAGEAGPVRQRVIARLSRFLHPLLGGPEGTGWDFGIGAHLSDLARVVESVPGVDAATGLELSIDGVVAGDAAAVGSDQIVCAGPIAVRLSGGA